MSDDTRPRLIIASHNPGKILEFQAVLGHRWQVRPQADLNIGDVEETGSTFVENALIKARHAASVSGLPALADDSGLAVDALGGAPGIYSARYAGGAGDAANNAKLLDALKDVPDAERGARFICALALLRHALELAAKLQSTGYLLTALIPARCQPPPACLVCCSAASCATPAALG